MHDCHCLACDRRILQCDVAAGMHVSRAAGQLHATTWTSVSTNCICTISQPTRGGNICTKPGKLAVRGSNMDCCPSQGQWHAWIMRDAGMILLSAHTAALVDVKLLYTAYLEAHLC